MIRPTMAGRRGWVLALTAAGLLASRSVQAQDPQARQAILQQIEQRFMARARQELGLNDEQAVKFRATVVKYGAERRRREAGERDIKQALAGQLRPGIAADKDSVAALLDRLGENRVEYIRIYDRELEEMAGYLDPVQRAQYVLLRERLLSQIRRIQAQRGGARDLNPF